MASSIVGVDRAIQFLRNSAIKIDEIHREVLLELAQSIEKDAKEDCPVKTGFLKASIRTEEEGKDVVVGAYAEYAGFVDGGTSKMHARPFLSSAVQVHSRKISQVWIEKVSNP